MSGSHTDTVAAGGRYDGSLGVIAALEVADAVASRARDGTAAGTFIAADFVNEEGVRFMPDMMGSLFHRGDLTLEDVRAATDGHGVTVGDALDRLGYAGEDTLDDIDVDAFVELHIEQGPILEHHEQRIGVVTGVQGLKWFEITCRGASNHAGTTPMHDRRDAARAAARLIDHVYQLADEIDGLRVTVGSMRAHPNLVNVIPDRLVFTVDIRHPHQDVLEDAERNLRARVRAAEADIADAVSIRALADAAPVEFDRKVVDAVTDAVKRLGISHRRMISGAGHDAQILASMMPAGMIFVPSRGGVSHNPLEFTEPDDLVAGAETLLTSVFDLIGVPATR
jgi:N-carbamoyl-L-amino-acid hydrolase